MKAVSFEKSKVNIVRCLRYQARSIRLVVCKRRRPFSSFGPICATDVQGAIRGKPTTEKMKARSISVRTHIPVRMRLYVRFGVVKRGGMAVLLCVAAFLFEWKRNLREEWSISVSQPLRQCTLNHTRSAR